MKTALYVYCSCLLALLLVVSGIGNETCNELFGNKPQTSEVTSNKTISHIPNSLLTNEEFDRKHSNTVVSYSPEYYSTMLKQSPQTQSLQPIPKPVPRVMASEIRCWQSLSLDDLSDAAYSAAKKYARENAVSLTRTGTLGTLCGASAAAIPASGGTTTPLTLFSCPAFASDVAQHGIGYSAETGKEGVNICEKRGVISHSEAMEMKDNIQIGNCTAQLGVVAFDPSSLVFTGANCALAFSDNENARALGSMGISQAKTWVQLLKFVR